MTTEAKPTVRCSVSNCHFWGEENLCRADKIAIEIDAYAMRNLKSEFAEEHYEEHQVKAKTSSGTCCLTFKPKSS